MLGKLTTRVTTINDSDPMSRNRGSRRKLTDSDRSNFIEELRVTIAANLDIDPDRIRYGPLEGGEQGRLGTAGDHWQIWYRDQWRELPWHFDGPIGVRRELARKWWG